MDINYKMLKRYIWAFSLLILIIVLFVFVYFAFIRKPWWSDLLYSDDIHPVLSLPSELELLTMTYNGRGMRQSHSVTWPPRSTYMHIFIIDNATEFYIQPPWFGSFWGITGNHENELFGHVLEFFDGTYWRMVPASYFDYNLLLAPMNPYRPMDSWELAVDINRIYGNLRRGLYRLRLQIFVHWRDIRTPEGYWSYYFPVYPPGPFHIMAEFILE